MSTPRINLKRVYEAPSHEDGMRVLVERLWPRGLSKTDAAIDFWGKDVAPTAKLRTWFGHRAELWEEFRRRYCAELVEKSGAVDELRSLCAGRKLTFVFAARNMEQNSAVVLREFLLSQHK